MAPKRDKKGSVETDADSTSQKGSTAQGRWELNSRVLCRYLSSDIYYEAKIIGLEEKNGEALYTVHYQGWNSRHDEKIGETVAAERFKAYTEQDAEKARDVVKKAQQSTKKRKSVLDGKKSTGGDDSSRASTPSVRSSVTDMPVSKRGRHQVANRKILTDDNNMINKQNMLPKVPAKITVAEIVQQYRNSLGINENKSNTNCSNGNKDFYIEYSESEDSLINPSSETCDQSALGLLDYFDMTIGSLLLYKFERPLYSDLYAVENAKLGQKEHEDSPEKDEDFTYGKRKIRLSNHFGLPHLLRLFVRFTEMLAFTQWSTRALDAIVRHAQDFVMFLSKHHQDYYNVDQDYIVAAPEYLKRVWSGANQ
uniref:MRG domain-containing protein n=1 Tax=Ditylenchus dipsaci TaxID=166011 RepID=A0A915CKB4_9BILA